MCLTISSKWNIINIKIDIPDNFSFFKYESPGRARIKASNKTIFDEITFISNVFSIVAISLVMGTSILDVQEILVFSSTWKDFNNSEGGW